MSNNVAREVTPQLWHTASRYGYLVASIRKLGPGDVDDVVRRIVRQLADDAARNPFVNPEISAPLLADALRESTSSTWVAIENRTIVGHLYGALLQSEPYGIGVWIGPDGVSYESTEVLSDLYAEAGQEWIDAGAREHYAWVLDDASSTGPWYELGFARMHLRGVLALDQRHAHRLPDGYTLRRGSMDDLDVAVELTTLIDRAQVAGPSFSLDLSTESQRDELAETLSDPEVNYFLVEHDGEAVGQCITFPLPPRRGSFDDTLHLSAVVVREQHQGRGVATAMVDAALIDARSKGFEFVETNWRVTNRRAQRYWLTYGFHPTYVRLHRTIGAR